MCAKIAEKLEADQKKIWDALRAEHYATCLELLDSMCREFPDDPLWRYLKGDVLRRLGSNQEAGAILLKIQMSAGKLRHRVEVSLGRLREDEGLLPEAESWLRRAVATMPSAEAPRIQLGAFLARRSRFAEAIGMYESALSLGRNDDDEVFLNIGMCWRALGDYSKAHEFASRAVAVSPDYEVAKVVLNDVENAIRVRQEKTAAGILLRSDLDK